MVEKRPEIPIRRYPRRELKSTVLLFVDNVIIHARSLQVSEGGILIASPHQFPVGTELTLHFVLGQNYVRTRACIIYHQPSKEADAYYCMGLKFIDIADFKVEVIRDFTNN